MAAAVAVATMRAGLVEAPGRARVTERPRPAPGPGERLVRLEGSGVCASSLPVWEGRPWFSYPLPPGAPGHEGWGVEVATGRRVAFASSAAFAEYEAVGEEALVPLPDAIEGPFPGEALGCAVNAFARGGIAAGDTVAVVGAGFLGLVLVQLAVAEGARVLAFSRRESSRALARRFGAETPEDAPEGSCDVAIEAAGAQETLDRAARLCRVRGRLVVAGFHQDGPRSVDMQLWNWRGLDVVNAHERDPALVAGGIRAGVELVAAGRLDPTPLLTHVFPLERLGEAFELLRRRPEGFVKAVVTAS